MTDYLMYDEGCLFDGLAFHGEALEFFSAIGHTSAVTPLIVAEDTLYCIYSEFNFTTFFDKNERAAFSCMESLSYLFVLGDEAFYQRRSLQIRYYAISLHTDKGNRTVVANTIINAFAKNVPDYIVILFRHERTCMLAFAKKSSGYPIFFSDWFDESDALEMMSRIDIGNLSLKNSNEFFLDFVYMVARKYYIEPISREYARSEWYFVNPLSYEGDGRTDWNECAAEVLNAHIFQYGDDYIDVPSAADYQVDEFDDNNIDFDLLELELEEMMAADLFEVNDNDFDDEDKDNYNDDPERINAADVPPDIMNDPIKLLEWLKQIEHLNEEKSVDESQ